MGKRGPRPKPTILKKLAGNPGKRKLNDEEPEPEELAEMPAPPAWLLPVAVQVWHEEGPKLRKMGLLTEPDLVPFACYCQCCARYLEAEAWMAENGTCMTLRNDKGEVKYSQTVPRFGLAVKMLEKMLRYQQEFGMTPSARTGLKVLKEKKPGDRLRLFNGA